MWNPKRLSVGPPLGLSVAAILCIAVSGLTLTRYMQGVTECQSNLKQLGTGILMYVQDYDERYPPMKFPAQIRNRVMPYVKNNSVFSCPTTSAEYLPNPALNYVSLAKVASPATTVMLRDAKAHTLDSGKSGWNVAYADGHVKLVLSEPKLGKPAPSPPPPSRSEMIKSELRDLRQQRNALDARIRQLESQQRHPSRR